MAVSTTAMIFMVASIRAGHFVACRSSLRNCLAHSVNQRTAKNMSQTQNLNATIAQNHTFWTNRPLVPAAFGIEAVLLAESRQVLQVRHWLDLEVPAQFPQADGAQWPGVSLLLASGEIAANGRCWGQDDHFPLADPRDPVVANPLPSICTPLPHAYRGTG
jgi:hypothetical protein